MHVLTAFSTERMAAIWRYCSTSIWSICVFPKEFCSVSWARVVRHSCFPSTSLALLIHSCNLCPNSCVADWRNFPSKTAPLTGTPNAAAAFSRASRSLSASERSLRAMMSVIAVVTASAAILVSFASLVAASTFSSNCSFVTQYCVLRKDSFSHSCSTVIP